MRPRAAAGKTAPDVNGPAWRAAGPWPLIDVRSSQARRTGSPEFSLMS